MRKEGFCDVAGGRIWYGIEGDADAPPLVVIHGGPGTPHNYLVSHSLLGDERPVLYYDQLGCGRSERPDNRALWRLPRFLQELDTLLAAIRREGVWTHDRVHLLGHSWGGVIAAEHALSSPDCVASLVLASPVLNFPRYAAHSKQLVRQLPAETQAVLERAEASADFESTEAQIALMEYYGRHFCRLDPWPDEILGTMMQFGRQAYETMQGPNEIVVTGNLRGYDCTPRLGAIRVPTLITCGRYDFADPDALIADHRAIPDSEIAIFENSAHVPHVEERQDYIAAIRDFLRRHD